MSPFCQHARVELDGSAEVPPGADRALLASARAVAPRFVQPNAAVASQESP